MGLWHPVIYLPGSLANCFSRDQLHAVLLHEAFHVKRGDLWVILLQGVARVLFFHHPATWWVNARLSALREDAVDQAVLSRPEVERRTYSLSLVEAASLGAAIRPNLALGVVETKSKLKHRIEMILHQARPRRVDLGFRGFLSIFLIGLVLVPMMPALAAAPKPAPAPSPEFRELDPAPLRQRVDTTVAGIMEAFNQRDIGSFVGAFTEQPFILAPGAPIITGRGGVAEMYLNSRDLIYEPMALADRDFYQIGNWIVETGLSGFNFRMSPSAPVMTDPRQFLTIWVQADDGTLKVKLLSWNKLGDPAQLNLVGIPGAFAVQGPESSFSTGGDFSAVLEAEKRFHEAFPAHEFATAASYYAPGANLVLPEVLPLHGRDAILAYMKAQPSEQQAIRVEQEPIHVEGNGNHVLVINLFRWTFQPPGQTPPVTFVGKGVHIWERQKDGSWKILFDLPNASALAG